MSSSESWCRRLTLLVLLALSWPAPAEEPEDTLALVRELSYGESWQQARPMLDAIEPMISPDAPRHYAEFQLLKARHETLGGEMKAAIQRMEQLLERELPDDQQIQALHSVAHAAVLLRDYEHAFDALGRALALPPERVANLHRIPILNLAAYMFGRVAETDRALQHGRRAIELARADGDLLAECISRQRLAPVLKWAERNQDAVRAYRLGIEQCRRVDNQLFVGVLQHGLADLLRQNGQPEEALGLATRSIDALSDGVFPLGENEARLVHAEILFELDPESLDRPPWPGQLEALESFMRERLSWDQLARLEALRANLSLNRGEPERAVEHLLKQMDARERFLGHERQMRLAYLEVQFDTRLKEQQIELLNEQARAAELESQATLQRQQLRNLILLLAGLLVVLLATLLLRTRRARRHFQHLSRHDGLTGLANHSWFFEDGRRIVRTARDDPGSLYLLLADIDFFKNINDSHGHSAGDRVLCELASILRASFGPGALIGRMGGEEFAVLATAPAPGPIFDAIRWMQERLKAPRQKAEAPVISLSIGLVRLADEEDLDDALRRADQLLYQAKAAGRDRIMAEEMLAAFCADQGTAEASRTDAPRRDP